MFPSFFSFSFPPSILDSLTTFAQSGRLQQVDHALSAVARGETAVGIKATNGVVIAAEKKSQSVLVDESTVERIKLVTKNIGMTYAGMGPDFRVLVNKGRKSSQEYFLEYKNEMPVSQLVREVANVAQEFTQSGMKTRIIVFIIMKKDERWIDAFTCDLYSSFL